MVNSHWTLGITVTKTKNMNVEDLNVYQLAMEVGDEIYFIVEKWDKFQEWTTGKQLDDASDYIAANISEGYGRYFYKENRQFQYYSRGSQTETRTWLTKALNRSLIDIDKFKNLVQKLEFLAKMHNAYINSIDPKNSDSR